MANWITVKAEEYCDAVCDGTHESPKVVDEGYRLVTSRHIVDGDIRTEEANRISEADYVRINERSKVNRNDVLISMIGTVGRVCRVSFEPNFAIKNIGLFKITEEIRSKYLYYYLHSKRARDYILSVMAGSTQAYISLGSLRELPICYPADRSTMSRIVCVLDCLDSKIKLSNRINDYLAAWVA